MQACYSRCQLASQACRHHASRRSSRCLSSSAVCPSHARWQPPAEQTAARPHAGCQASRLGARTACSSFHSPYPADCSLTGQRCPISEAAAWVKLAAKGSRPNAGSCKPGTVAGRPAMGAGSSARLRHADSAGLLRPLAADAGLSSPSVQSVCPVSSPICGIFASTEGSSKSCRAFSQA